MSCGIRDAIKLAANQIDDDEFVLMILILLRDPDYRRVLEAVANAGSATHGMVLCWSSNLFERPWQPPANDNSLDR